MREIIGPAPRCVWGEGWGDALIGERQRRKELMATESQQLGMQWTKGEPRSLGAGSTLRVAGET